MAKSDVTRKAIDAFNRHDAAAFAATYAEDAVVHDPYYSEPLRGRAAIEKDMAEFMRAFPDVSVVIKTIVEDGGSVAAEVAVRGTHLGPLALPGGEIPATGRLLEAGGAHFHRVNSQGLIVEDHRYYDVLGQMTQLGLLPEQVGV